MKNQTYRMVCANLPYNITTPVLSRFVEADCFESVTVMAHGLLLKTA